MSYTDYKCPTCKKRYRRFADKANFSCCVIHAAGDCCHAFEVRVSKHGIVKGMKPIDLSGMSQTIGPVCTCGSLSIPCMVHNVTVTYPL